MAFLVGVIVGIVAFICIDFLVQFINRKRKAKKQKDDTNINDKN